MQSLAWMNGQYRQEGPLSQPPKAASLRNLQRGTENQCMTAQTGAQPPHNAKVTHYYVAYSQRKPSDGQITADHQAVSFQQTSGGNNYLQPSPIYLQSGNPSLQVTYGSKPNYHQNAAQNLSTRSQPNMTLAYIVCPQQDISPNGNQSVVVHGAASIKTQNGSFVSDGMFQNSCAQSNKPILPYTMATTSHQPREVASNGTMGPGVHHRPTAHETHYRENGSRHGFNPPCTSNSSSLHVYRPIRISQQYLTHNNGGEASSSIYSNSLNGQAVTNLSLSNPNDSPSNPAADAHAQQDLLKQRQSIARIEDYLRMPTTTGSDGHLDVYTSSLYGRKQDVSMVTMRESNQNKQPVTSTEMYNSNVSQETPQSLRPSSPKATRNVMSIQHSIDVQPQQSSLPNVLHVSAKRDIIGNVSQAIFSTENNVSSSSSQLKHLLQCNKSQRIENQSVEKNCDRLEMLPVKANDSSIYSSPGRTRAVAVVQPLLHESYQVACKQNSSNTTSQLSEGNESLRYPVKQVISPKTKKVGNPKVVLTQKPPNQMRSNTHEIRHSATSNDGAFISPSSSARPRDSFQKPLHTVDSGSKLDIDTQVHQRVSATAQQSVTFEAPVSPNGDKNNSEVPMDTKGVELSSVPTTLWNYDALTKRIQDCEKAQVALKISMNTLHKLFIMFWNGNLIQFKSEIIMGTYTTIMANARQFFRENVEMESVILSQVKSSFKTQLKNYHVLKENEVYSELPYKSSWLNVNEQLDDIDKEFDFPPSLKDHLKGLKSDGQLDIDNETDDSIPAQTVKEVSNKMSPKELDPVDPSEEKQDSLDATTSTPMASPSKTERADSSDPYSFKIQVLPPEDAKVIFEQAQSNLPESIDMDYQPERLLTISVEEELPMVIDPTLSNSKLEDKAFLPIAEVCCIERLKETICGSKTTSLSKCQCNVIQSHKDITEKTCVKEVIAVQEEDAFRFDGILHSATERENNSPLTAFLWPEIIDVFSHTIDVPEDDDTPQDPKNISHISIDSRESSIICLSDEEEHLASSDSDIPNQMPYFEYDSQQARVKWTESGQSSSSHKKETNTISTNLTEIQSDPEVECVSDQLKVTRDMHSWTSVRSDNKTEELASGESEVASQMTNLDENCGQTELSATNVEDSSLETEEQQTVISAMGAREKSWSRKLKRPRSPGRSLQVSRKSKKCKSTQPILEGTSKPRKAFMNGTDGEHSPSVAQTVELFLYGSTRPNKYVLRSSPEAASHSGSTPPKVLSVNLSPLKRKTIKTVRTWDYSVKQLYKRWKISLPPAKSGRRKKKAWKCTFASSSKLRIKKADTIGPVDTEELPVSSEMRISNGKTKPYRNLSWRRSLSKELSFDEVKRTALFKQPADQERTNAEDGSEAVGPLQNNNILQFSVLPVSFTFGSNGRQETEDPGQETPDLVEGKDDNHNKSDNCSVDTWYSNAEKQFHPPPPYASSLFHAFQKTYMDKMQRCVDK